MHITREIHQFYTFLKSDIHRKYTVYSEYFWCLPDIHPIHKKYTFNSEVCVGQDFTGNPLKIYKQLFCIVNDPAQTSLVKINFVPSAN